jgi:RNA polymerase sigma factor (sigma-70 family)
VLLRNFFYIYSQVFFEKLRKTTFPKRDRSERGRTPPPAVREGGERLLELTPSQKKTVRHQFDSFCRKVLREEARDYIREISRLAEHEVSLSELSEEQMDRLYVLDEYPSEQRYFDVQGYHVIVRDDRLAEALSSLPDEKRDIVLLSYFLDMSDREIGEKLNMVRYTVQRRRTSSLAEMRKRMEVNDNGEQSD